MKVPLWTGKVLDFKMYVLHKMRKPVVLNLEFLTRATHLYGLYYMMNNDKRHWIIDIPLNVLTTNYNTNYIDCTILNRFQVEIEVR